MNTKGYTLITGIILLMTIMMLGLISISTLFWNSSSIHAAFQQGRELAAANDGCIEEGLLGLKQDPSFRTVSLSIADYSCTITLNNPVADVYSGTVVAQAVDGKRMSIAVQFKRTPYPQSAQVKIISYLNL